MVVIRKYAKNISQTSGVYKEGSNPRRYRTFTNISALKTDDSNYALCSDLGGANGTWNRPSTLTFRNFDFNLPDYAKIVRITVGYGQGKITYSSKTAYPKINAPLITLLNVSGYSSRGNAVPATYTKFTKKFDAKPKPSSVNSSNFGVSINYPTNTNTNNGAMKVGYCWIEIEYEDLNFSITAKTLNNNTRYLNETFDMQLNLSNLSKTRIDYNSIVKINLPSGLEFVGTITGSGSLNKNSDGSYSWISSVGSTFQSSITLRFKCVKTGSQTISFAESSTGVNTKLNVFVNEDRLKLDIESPDFAVEDEEFVLKCKAGTIVPRDTEGTVYFEFPPQLKITSIITENENSLFEQEGTSINWIPNTIEKEDIISISIVPESANIFDYYISTTIPFNDNNKYSIKVKPSDLTIPFSSFLELNEDVIGRMGTNIVYKVISFFKMNIIDDDIALIDEYAYNYRLGVFNNEVPENPDEFTEEYILSKAEFSDPILQANTLKELSLEFKYDEKYPVIIIFTGEYLESNVRAFSIDFSNPIIIESEYYDSLEPTGIFPAPFKSLISQEDFAATELFGLTKTNRIRLYNYTMGGLETRDDMVIQGLEVHLNINCDNPCSLLIKVLAPNGNIGERSLNIGRETGEKTIGGKFDLCGLDFEDYRNLDSLEIELIQLNPFDHDTYLEINNIYLIVHYLQLEGKPTVDCFVNGINIKYYNMFLQNLEIPAGTENSVKYLKVEGTDSNTPYRSNIDSKEITLEFNVFGDNLEENSLFMERIGNLFKNARDDFNKPILNTIEFSHYPNRLWEFIQEGSIESTAEITSYSGTIKLTVPDGTSRSKEPIITNAQGINASIAKVTPIIQLMPFADEITVTEDVSKQVFIIRKTGLSNSNIISIDCTKRKVFKLDKQEDGTFIETDITDSVDFSSDWFLIQGEYRFSCENSGSIQSVELYERW